MTFFEVDEHDLADARPGLLLVERLLQDEHFVPYIYGLTSKEDVLLAAQAAIGDDMEEDENGNQPAPPEPKEVAVAIPFGADTIYYLEGSGLTLQQEDFEYRTGGPEGSRNLSFRWSGMRPRIHLSDFSKMALSATDMDLDEFLKQYGQKVEVSTQVSREPVPAVKQSRTASSNRVSEIDKFLAD